MLVARTICLKTGKLGEQSRLIRERVNLLQKALWEGLPPGDKYSSSSCLLVSDEEGKSFYDIGARFEKLLRWYFFDQKDRREIRLVAISLNFSIRLKKKKRSVCAWQVFRLVQNLRGVQGLYLKTFYGPNRFGNINKLEFCHYQSHPP
jgi:hypothetical protein